MADEWKCMYAHSGHLSGRQRQVLQRPRGTERIPADNGLNRRSNMKWLGGFAKTANV